MTKVLQDVSLGNNLRKYRKLKGLTQAEVCARLTLLGRPMQQSNYALIESGHRNIFISDLVALKQIFGVSYNDLFEGITIKSKDHE